MNSQLYMKSRVHYLMIQCFDTVGDASRSGNGWETRGLCVYWDMLLFLNKYTILKNSVLGGSNCLWCVVELCFLIGFGLALHFITQKSGVHSELQDLYISET